MRDFLRVFLFKLELFIIKFILNYYRNSLTNKNKIKIGKDSTNSNILSQINREVVKINYRITERVKVYKIDRKIEEDKSAVKSNELVYNAYNQLQIKKDSEEKLSINFPISCKKKIINAGYRLDKIIDDEPPEPRELEDEMAKVDKKNLTREEYYIKLAKLHIKYDCIPQAIRYYTLAIRRSPKKESLYCSRAKLQYERGNKRAYIDAYTELTPKLDPENNQLLLINCAKKLSKLLISEKNHSAALEAIEPIFHHCPHLLTEQEVGLYLHILLKLNKYNKCIDMFSKYTCIKIGYQVIDSKIEELNYSKNTVPTTAIRFCKIPRNTHIILKFTCIILFIDLGYINKVDCYIDELLTLENIKIYSNHIMDLVKSLMRKQNYSRARKFLKSLISYERYSELVIIWILYAECCVECFANEEFDASAPDESTADPIIRSIWPIVIGNCCIGDKWRKLGFIYREHGFEEQAVVCFSKAISIDPKNPEVYDKISNIR
ncbi:uncharacterized protein LOC103570648 [Microplitis demolitor]|uniref:uncharacterized protein LOC103570648 n=1 Tax=Microplitis demolitor TaxID=69319 RepID=UPI0004CCF378|nr:uncharacterized protein LOC103570648 [Microplitis demolitor]